MVSLRKGEWYMARAPEAASGLSGPLQKMTAVGVPLLAAPSSEGQVFGGRIGSLQVVPQLNFTVWVLQRMVTCIFKILHVLASLAPAPAPLQSPASVPGAHSWGLSVRFLPGILPPAPLPSWGVLVHWYQGML